MAGAGYEDQPIADDPSAVASDERLRQAFAQLLAVNQQKEAVPLEALWAAQGRSQFPAPRQTQRWDLPPGVDADADVMPQQQLSMNPQGLNFPTAPQGPMSPLRNQKPPPDMLPVPDEPREPSRDKPFHGKGEVVGPYELPKKKNKKKNKKGDD